MGKNDQNEIDIELLAQKAKSLSGKKVIVGVTGRIDSAVACLMLQKQGMKVFAVSLVNFSGQEFDQNQKERCYIDNLDAIRDIYDDLDIPFYAVDARSEFFDKVLDNYIGKKIRGVVPNACFNCHKLRMELLYQKMFKLNADFFATGHYAKLHKNFLKNEFNILQANDLAHDQSIFLSEMTNEQIAHLLLPIGELKKSEVEKIAKRFFQKLLPPGIKREECMKINQGKIDFLKNHIPESLRKTGPVTNIANDNYYGEHDGVYQYEIGEVNQEFKTLGTKLDKKISIVGYTPELHRIELGSPQFLSFNSIQIRIKKISKGFERHRPFNAHIFVNKINKILQGSVFFKNNSTAIINFSEKTFPLLIEDFVVIYIKSSHNLKLVCSGNIMKRFEFEPVDRVSEYRVAEVEDELLEEEEIVAKKAKKERFVY